MFLWEPQQLFMWQSLETKKSKWWQHRWLWATSELARSAREPLYLKIFVKKCLSDTQTTLPKAKDKPRCMIFQGNKAHQFCQTGVWRKLREVHGLKDPSECKCSWVQRISSPFCLEWFPLVARMSFWYLQCITLLVLLLTCSGQEGHGPQNAYT